MSDRGSAWSGQSFGNSRTLFRMAKLFLFLTASVSASDTRTLATYAQSFVVENTRIFNAGELITFETIMASHAANITEVDGASCDLMKQQLAVNPGGSGEGMAFANLVEYSILWSSSEEDVEQKFQNSLNADLITLSTLLQVGGLNVTKSSEAVLLLQIDDPGISPSPEQLPIPSPSVVLGPTMPPTSLTSSPSPSSNAAEIVMRGQYIQQFTVNNDDVFDDEEIAYFESTLESYTENISDVATNASCTVLLQRLVQPLPDTAANQVEYTMEWTTSDEEIASKFSNFINENLDGLTVDLQAGGLSVSESSSALALLVTQPPSASPTAAQVSDSPATMVTSLNPSITPSSQPPIVASPSTFMPSFEAEIVMRGQYIQQFTVNNDDVFDDEEIAYFESTLESYTENISDVATNASCTVLLQRLVQPLPLRRRLQGDTVIYANQVEYAMEWKSADEDIASKFSNFINGNLDGLTVDLQAGGLSVSESSFALALLVTHPPSASPTAVQVSDSPATMVTSLNPSITPSSQPPIVASPSTFMPSSKNDIVMRGQYIQQFTVTDDDVFDDEEIAYFESTLESYTENISDDVATNASCTVLLQRLVQPLPLRRRLQGDTVIYANQVEYAMEWKTSDEDIASKFSNFINENLDGLTVDLQAGGLSVSESSSALALLVTQPPSASPTAVQASDSPSTMLQSGIPSFAPTVATSDSPSTTTPMVPSDMPSLGTTSTDMPSSSHGIGVVASLVPVVLLGVFTLIMV